MWEYIVGGFVAVTVVPAVVQVGIPALWQAVRPKVRGAAGESAVNRCLKKFKGKDFARFHDVMLPAKGKTSQIDNILVSPQGIFVIETKNYAGSVIGDEKSSRWMHVTPGIHGKTREFYNPIWQNQGHIRALRDLLKESYPNLKFHNVVVFSDECRPPKVNGVVTIRELHKFLKKEMQGPPVLTDKDVAAIKKVISKSNITDKKKRKEHVENAQYVAMMSKELEKAGIFLDRSEGVSNRTAKSPNVQASPRQERSVFSDDVKKKENSEKTTLSSQIQAAKAQKNTAQPIEQVIRQDIFMEL